MSKTLGTRAIPAIGGNFALLSLLLSPQNPVLAASHNSVTLDVLWERESGINGRSEKLEWEKLENELS